MKKIAVSALLLVLCVATVPALAENKKAMMARIENMTEEQRIERISEIKTRVDEIKNMDRSSMSRTERVTLKKELKELNRESSFFNGKGVYLSLGAIIIIILLLILIL